MALSQSDAVQVKAALERQAKSLGFDALGVAGIDLEDAESRLAAWLEKGFHGEMDYMERHGKKRSRPELLVPGTLSVIAARMDYWPPAADAQGILAQPNKAYVSRYALGRDYHRTIRNRLQKLASWLESEIGPFGYRVFCDSAPVLERALAEQAGLGWIGKHTNLIEHDRGSWFFLGEIYTDLELPADAPSSAHCGTCRACIDVCPTSAIVAPYQVDARRCISYLTIELHGSIPEEYRPLIGNRIYGCDDCQLFCPWNKFATHTTTGDFSPRHSLDDAKLTDLFSWTEQEFLSRTEGSAIRRIGHVRWLRNIAVALGNAPSGPDIVAALKQRLSHGSELVREHVHWALGRHG